MVLPRCTHHEMVGVVCSTVLEDKFAHDVKGKLEGEHLKHCRNIRRFVLVTLAGDTVTGLPRLSIEGLRPS